MKREKAMDRRTAICLTLGAVPLAASLAGCQREAVNTETKTAEAKDPLPS